jgi:hypothetical protein
MHFAITFPLLSCHLNHLFNTANYIRTFTFYYSFRCIFANFRNKLQAVLNTFQKILMVSVIEKGTLIFPCTHGKHHNTNSVCKYSDLVIDHLFPKISDYLFRASKFSLFSILILSANKFSFSAT